MDLDRGLLDVAVHRLFKLSVFRLDLDRGIKILCHFVSGEAYEACVELEAQVWLKGDVYLLLRFGIDYAFMIIELEAAV